jgi:hypothetical protein
MARKPKTILKPTASHYPLVQVTDATIWMQNTPKGQWKKVPVGRAKALANRLVRAARYVKQQKRAHA